MVSPCPEKMVSGATPSIKWNRPLLVGSFLLVCITHLLSLASALVGEEATGSAVGFLVLEVDEGAIGVNLPPSLMESPPYVNHIGVHVVRSQLGNPCLMRVVDDEVPHPLDVVQEVPHSALDVFDINLAEARRLILDPR